MTLDKTKTDPSTGSYGCFTTDFRPISALLVAYCPSNTLTVDHFILESSVFRIGRRTKENDLASDDTKISGHHARITVEPEGVWIEDLGSTNGTYVDGQRIRARRRIREGSLIRVGQTLLVYHTDARPLLEPLPSSRFEIAGKFHVMPILKELKEASLSDRHILIAGPSGSGKELAAEALAKLQKCEPFFVYNGARFTSEEEVESTLFGVAKRVFSNVDGRIGLIEQANEGMLFLDEVHNLPRRVQRSLLRIIEDGRFSRIGETKARPVNLRFVFASNDAPPTYGLAHDFLARLRVVSIPKLSERISDIPAIFSHLIEKIAVQRKLDKTEIDESLSAKYYEALCLDTFPEDNVRGLLDLADRIVTRIQVGESASVAIRQVFAEHYARKANDQTFVERPTNSNEELDRKRLRDTCPDNDDLLESLAGEKNSPTNVRSRYEKNREAIIEAFYETGGVISATCNALRRKNINCNPRWLSIFLERWGVRERNSRTHKDTLKQFIKK